MKLVLPIIEKPPAVKIEFYPEEIIKLVFIELLSLYGYLHSDSLVLLPILDNIVVFSSLTHSSMMSMSASPSIIRNFFINN